LSRAWPFQDTPEGGEGSATPPSVAEFIEAHHGVEAVVIRIGLNDAQLVLVDAGGDWDRWVHHSVEEARAAAEDFDLPIHEAAFPEEMRVRMNARRRPRAEYELEAYPEQGRVGPVIPYPENRPRRLDRRDSKSGSGS
jgi:hypothetical protein